MLIRYSVPDLNFKDISEVKKSLRSNFLTQGRKVLNFENKISSVCKSKYSIATNSATSALYIAYRALGLGKNDNLWTSANTFVATANCALQCGAKVDFIDIDPNTYNLCVKSLEKKLLNSKKKDLPKIVVPVHMAGLPCDLEKIYKLSKKYNFKIIEDASHAIGSFYKGYPTGSCKFSEITIFSFHAIKVLTTGEGGAAVTNNKKYFDKMKILRSHGITSDPNNMYKRNKKEIWNYQQIDLSFNFRLTEFQCALGLSQLARLKKIIFKRKKIAEVYDGAFLNTKLQLPFRNKDYSSSNHLYIIRLDNFKNTNQRKIYYAMQKLGIELNIHYIPVYLHPFYKKKGFKKGYCPESEKYFKNVLSLPLHTKLNLVNQKKVILTLLNLIK